MPNEEMSQGTQGEKVTEETDTAKRNKKWIIPVAICGGVFLIYIGFSIFFMNHYFFRTWINGVDVSLKSEGTAGELVINHSEDYILTITGRDDMTEVVDAKDIELKVALSEEFYQVKKSQNGFAWVKGIFVKSEYTPQNIVSYNVDTFEKQLAGMRFFQEANIRPARDAYVGNYDKQTKEFSIIPEDYGTRVYITRAKIAIRKAVKKLNSALDLDADGCYENPLFFAEDAALAENLETMNAYAKTVITYDWNDAEEIIDGELISTWLSSQKGKVIIDKEAIEAYVTEKAEEHDTYGKNRDFKTYKGITINLRSGAFGWQTNQEAETSFIIETMKTGETVDREPEYLATGAVKGMDDIGNTYVEVDMSAQHLYLWQEGVVTLDCDIVSGDIDDYHGTPPGVFAITGKARDVVLRGPDYESFVYYWMPFNGPVGMHDATWRWRFGGTIYKTNGSHGCINLPTKAAATIYATMYVGFPVICYY